MRNNNFFLVILLLGSLMTMISCSTRDSPIDLEMASQVVQESDLVSEADAELIESLNFSVANAELKPFHYPDGTTEDRYYVEGDIVFTSEEYRELLDNAVEGIVTRQYSTYNLCSSPQTINVIGYTGGGGYGLSNKMRTSLGWAINNYNNAGIDLNFTLNFGTNYGPYDIVVYRVPNGSAGGSAGFPSSNGAPYKWVQIYSGMDNYNNNVVEHVMTHEIGHCVGLRHTDWFNRASCGGGGESAGGIGAVHIPGTPTNIDWNSIMLACFGSNEDGEFSNIDKTALRYLY